LLPARVPALNQFFLVKTLSGRAGYREHLNERNQAQNWSFEAGDRKQEEGRSQKKCCYKYEMLPAYKMLTLLL